MWKYVVCVLVTGYCDFIKGPLQTVHIEMYIQTFTLTLILTYSHTLDETTVAQLSLTLNWAALALTLTATPAAACGKETQRSRER